MIPVIIVSHKRADNVITKYAIDNCIICVPESQADEYKHFNPDNELLIHPDSVVGLSPKRQWILNKVGDCFQTDDDVRSVNRVYVPDNYEKPYVLTSKEAYDLIQDEYNLAKEMGVKLFGFNRSANPFGYNGNRPIDHNKYICGGGLGLISGGKLFFPDYPFFVGEDYWINALNAHYYRFSFIDQRFTFSFMQTEKGKGGVADYRTMEKRKETYFFLKQKFGDAIQPKRKSTIKKTVNKWEKTLKIPY